MDHILVDLNRVKPWTQTVSTKLQKSFEEQAAKWVHKKILSCQHRVYYGAARSKGGEQPPNRKAGKSRQIERRGRTARSKGGEEPPDRKAGNSRQIERRGTAARSKGGEEPPDRKAGKREEPPNHALNSVKYTRLTCTSLTFMTLFLIYNFDPFIITDRDWTAVAGAALAASCSIGEHRH